MPKEELLDELGIPLTPVRLKCAILGLGVLKLALHKAKGTPLPEEWGTSSPRPRPRVGGRGRGRAARRASAGRDAARAGGLAHDRRLQLRRAAATRSRIAARTTTGRSARGVGAGGVRRRLPAARLALRPRERDPDVAPGVRGRADLSRCPCATTAWSSSRCPTDARRARARGAGPARGRGRGRARGGPSRDAALAAGRADDGALPVRARRVPGGRSRCSRSAARAATRRSGSPPARACSAGASSRSSTIRPSARRGATNIADAGLEEWAELVEGDAHATLARDGGRVRPRLPRRREGRLRGALRARAAAARAGRRSSSPTTSSRTSRRSVRTRQRARRIRRSRASRSRSTAASSCRDRSARPAVRPERAAAFLHPLEARMLALPRKGGGPA